MNNNIENKITEATESKNKATLTKSAKVGTYTVIITLVFLAALIVLNLILSSLPSRFTSFDTTANNKYSVSDATKAYIATVNKPVTIYFICSGGTEDPEFGLFLKRYAELNSHLTIEVVDPVANPTFLDAYEAGQASNFSVIIKSEKRHKLLDFYNDMYYVYVDGYGKLTYEEYMYYANYIQSQGLTTTLYFDGDAKLTNGIEYVLSDNLPQTYIMSGHQEAALSAELLGYFSGKYSDLNLITDTSVIPDNASLIIINAPSVDITPSEAVKLKAYLAGGGHIYLTTPYNLKMPNLMSVLADYGLSADDKGIVYENDADMHVKDTPNYIYPVISNTHELTAAYAQQKHMTLMMNAHGIVVSDTPREGVVVTSLFTTSDKAYTKNDDESKNEGAFVLGAVAEESAVGTKIVWVASSSFLTDDTASMVAYGNYNYFLYAQSMLVGSFVSSLPEINASDIGDALLTVSEGQSTFWGVTLIFIIPLIAIAFGIIICVKRRRR